MSLSICVVLGPSEQDSVTSERWVMGVVTGPCCDSIGVPTVPHSTGVPGVPGRVDGG